MKLKVLGKKMGSISDQKNAQDYQMENNFIPITLGGVIIPVTYLRIEGRGREFKLACTGGSEYLLEADEDWAEILAKYKWEEVRVVGLLNRANMTIIPQKLFSSMPNGEDISLSRHNSWIMRSFDAAKAVGDESANPSGLSLCAI